MTGHARETRPFASEIKFLVDAVTGENIRDWARLHLDADPHGSGRFGDEYRTTSLYFDTDAGDVFFRRGSFGRAKYRVRRYGEANAVFLERKLRRPGVLSKRRTIVTLDALGFLDRDASGPAWDGEWFHRRLLLRREKPICQISYVRMARTAGTPEGPVRLTLDADVRVAAAHEAVFGTDPGQPVLDRMMILELKFRHHLPALFKQLVENFALCPQRASKYRLGVEALGDSSFPLALPAAADFGARLHV